jgi:ABC-2 type transport system permease protein
MMTDSLIDSFTNVWTLAKKNITLYIKRGPVLIFGLMFPLFLVISWILGRSITIAQIFIGLIAMTSFFTSTAIAPVVFPIETREKSLERLLSAPVSLNEILIGITVASSLYSAIITSLIAIVFVLIVPTLMASPISLLIILIGIVLMGILGSFLALLISATPSDMTSDIMILMNIVKFPLLFIGGVFVSLHQLPSALRFVYFFSPLTFLTEILREQVDASNVIPLGLNLVILIAWIIILFLLNLGVHRKTMPKRFSEASGGPKMKKK